MNRFLEIVEEELDRQKKLMSQSEKQLARAPKGYLKTRSRKRGVSFYQGDSARGRSFEQNITEDFNMIEDLLRKKIARETCKRAEKNIFTLEKIRKNYVSNDYEDILETAAGCYEKAALMVGQEKTKNGQGLPVQHCFDPQKHIHETICGLLVRSKSEVIITNALTGYGIPFEYEKRFPYADERGVYFEPDFTFHLPDGQWKIWEHLGMLNDPDYCIHNAYKLHTYQKHNFLIGRNLIITQDDLCGNCSSLYIDKMIREHLLPFYRKQ